MGYPTMHCTTCKVRVERAQKEVDELERQTFRRTDEAKHQLRGLLIHMCKLTSYESKPESLVPLQQGYLQMGEMLKQMEEAEEIPKAMQCLLFEAQDRLHWAQELAKNCTHTEPTRQVVHYVA